MNTRAILSLLAALLCSLASSEEVNCDVPRNERFSGAGVLPLEWLDGELVAAFEVTHGTSKYGTLEDFGGSSMAPDSDHFETALRESHEETCGVLSLTREALEAAPMVAMPSLEPDQAYATFLPIINENGEALMVTSRRLRDATTRERARDEPRSTWLEALDVRLVSLRALLRVAQSGGGSLDSTARVLDVKGREVRLSPRGLALVNAAHCQGVLRAVLESHAPTSLV